MTNEKEIALVTGGNKGIGLEISRNLGGAGCTVLLSARNAVRSQQAVRALEEVPRPEKAFAMPTIVTNGRVQSHLARLASVFAGKSRIASTPARKRQRIWFKSRLAGSKR